MLKPWELEIKKEYYVDDYGNIFKDTYDYCEFILNECTEINDGIEDWLDKQCEENLIIMTGAEIIASKITELEATIEYLEEKLGKE